MIIALRRDELLPEELKLFDAYTLALGQADIEAAAVAQTQLCALIRTRGYTAYEMPAEYLRLSASMQQKSQRLQEIHNIIFEQNMTGLKAMATFNLQDGAEFPPEFISIMQQQSSTLAPLATEQSGLMQELMQDTEQLEAMMHAAGVDQQKLATEATAWEYPEEHGEIGWQLEAAYEARDIGEIERLFKRRKMIEDEMGIQNLGNFIQ
jgi:hypothetical protein